MSRVLFVVNDAQFFLSHRASLAAEIRAAGHDVHVATPPGPGVREIELAGYAHHAVDMQRGGMNPLQDFVTLVRFVSLFRRVAPDLVHLVTIKPVLYGGMAARLCGVPAVVFAL